MQVRASASVRGLPVVRAPRVVRAQVLVPLAPVESPGVPQRLKTWLAPVPVQVRVVSAQALVPLAPVESFGVPQRLKT